MVRDTPPVPPVPVIGFPGVPADRKVAVKPFSAIAELATAASASNFPIGSAFGAFLEICLVFVGHDRGRKTV